MLHLRIRLLCHFHALKSVLHAAPIVVNIVGHNIYEIKTLKVLPWVHIVYQPTLYIKTTQKLYMIWYLFVETKWCSREMSSFWNKLRQFFHKITSPLNLMWSPQINIISCTIFCVGFIDAIIASLAIWTHWSFKVQMHLPSRNTCKCFKWQYFLQNLLKPKALTKINGYYEVEPPEVETMLKWVTFVTLDFFVYPTTYGRLYHSRGIQMSRILSTNHVGT